MPTYGYKCTKCDHAFEVFQSVNDSPITICPKCGSKTSRVFYPVGIIFKGPGFHINDYCRPKKSHMEKDKAPSSKAKTAKESPNNTTDNKTEKAS